MRSSNIFVAFAAMGSIVGNAHAIADEKVATAAPTGTESSALAVDCDGERQSLISKMQELHQAKVNAVNRCYYYSELEKFGQREAAYALNCLDPTKVTRERAETLATRARNDSKSPADCHM